MMLPVTHMLALGAWLVTQSKATPDAPKISIFLRPPGVISPGGSTNICCSCQRDSGNFVLYKDGYQIRTLELHGSRAEFSISNATHQDAGAYSCHYIHGGTVLARSETLEVMVQDFHLPTPDLSVLPGLEVAAGAYVTFRCTIEHSSAACYLYLEGHFTVRLNPEERENFKLPRVSKEKEGRYSCQCFAKLEWSAASQTLDLVVRDYTRTNGRGRGRAGPRQQPRKAATGFSVGPQMAEAAKHPGHKEPTHCKLEEDPGVQDSLSPHFPHTHGRTNACGVKAPSTCSNLKVPTQLAEEPRAQGTGPHRGIL
ncbi:natural cytotoxicity triggering receptor 1-like isoform X1 [Phalacrocorax aristotelis]|uniref:natural cytotoxicity triggering receptor 1-like isoform X1 n=1 Tax=Phalacrocorax aristotelis TaxID=126867 RepID=UPI003F4C4717